MGKREHVRVMGLVPCHTPRPQNQSHNNSGWCPVCEATESNLAALEILEIAEVSLQFHLNSLRMSRHIKLLQLHKLVHRSSSTTVRPALRQFIFSRSAVMVSFYGCSERSCGYLCDIGLACGNMHQ